MADSGKLSDIQNVPALNSFDEDIPDSKSFALPRFSVNQMTTLHASFKEDLTIRQLAGVSAIGLWRKKIEEFGEQNAVEAVRESGLDVTTLSYAGGFSGSAGLLYREALDDGYDAVFTAAAVGASTVVVSPGARGRYTARHEHRLISHAIRELSFVAEELGIRLAVMPRTSRYAGRWTSMHSLQDAVTLCDATGRSNVGVVYDNFYLADDPEGLRVAEQCAARIFTLQLRDACETGSPEYDQCVPGTGNLPLQETIQCLFENGFTGNIDVQIFSEQLWKQDSTDVMSSCQQSVSDLLRRCLAGSAASVGA
ncbi:MAG: sugar phosphate isomerase/epimerase [Rhodopirellula sp.]|nr:sugar phosphate isomerase/epimerase [Rhodopirellula sp.]